MAAPSIAAVGTFLAGASSASAAVPVPSGMAANEIALTVIYTETTATIGSPTGFTECTDSPISNSNGTVCHVFWKRATAADSGTYAFTLSSAGWREAVCSRLTGCITTGNPFEATNSAGGSTVSTASPAVSLTTLAADRLLFHAGFDMNATGTTTPSSGFTNSAVNTSGGIVTAYKAQAVAGASGSVSCTFTNSGAVSAWLGAFVPVGGAAASSSQFFPFF